MKILVTGAAGFIGSHLVTRLVEAGHEVCGIDNIDNGRICNLHHIPAWTKKYFSQVDLLEYEKMIPHVEGKDIIFHLAAKGSVPLSFVWPDEFFDNNVVGTQNLLLLMRHFKVPKIVFASSSSVYGDQPTSHKFEESLGVVKSPYAASKRMCEILIETTRFCASYEYINLRLFNVFGPRQRSIGEYAPVIAKWLQHKKMNYPVDIRGDTIRDYTYVDNVIDAFIACLNAGHASWNETYNIGCGVGTSLKKLLEHCDIKMYTENPRRDGDILTSIAGISKAGVLLDYKPKIDVKTGVDMLWKLEYSA